MKVWGIHNDRIPASELIAERFVAVGWDEVGDLAGIGDDLGAIREAVDRQWPEFKPRTAANAASVLHRFAFAMSEGDLAVAPDPRTRTINIGRVSGPYRHDTTAPIYRHRRTVEWLRTGMPRGAFPELALRQVSIPRTLVEVRTPEEFIAAIEGRPGPAPEAGRRAVPGTRRTFHTDVAYELAEATEFRQHTRSGLHHTPDCPHGTQRYDVVSRDETIDRWRDTPSVPPQDRPSMLWCETCAAVPVKRSRDSAVLRDDLPFAIEQIRPLTDAFRRAVLESDSVFSQGVPVWTAANADELRTVFVDRPDEGDRSFDDKLADQLHGASDGALQLFAELWCLSLAPLSDYNPATKRRLLAEALDRMEHPASIPERIDAALETTAFKGGVAFKTRRPFQLALLVRIASALLELDDQERASAVVDPRRFDELLASVPDPNEPAQRHALRWVLFPEHHIPIVSESHRAAIRDAFADLVTDQTVDRDQQLLEIRDILQEAGPEGSVNFYVPPLVDRWQPGAEQRRAWLVRGSNVGGRNLVPQWLSADFVSLAATHIPAVDASTTKAELVEMVGEGYGHIGYSARTAKVEELHQFLSQMAEGDLVLTVSQGKTYFGEIDGSADYVASEDSLSNLRRPVAWSGPSGGIANSELPKELSSRMEAQHDVLNLTQQLSAIERLLDSEAPDELTPMAEDLELPDATSHLARELHVGQAWLQEVIELLRDRPQLIFYGPPGTGKTFLAQKIAEHLADGDSSQVKLVQFHPAYSYEDFFEGYRPTKEGTFELTPGPMRRIVDLARENPSTPYILIIDEINRGNLAKVFGELYFLLEYREKTVDLMYAPDDAAGFTLPDNVFILGTMNTADRSIALVDSAMRRRFSFVSLHPAAEPTSGLLRRWLEATGRPTENADLLAELNRRIEGPDFKIGPSYFMRAAVYSEGGLERMWRTSILPLLEEHHFGDGTDIDRTYGLGVIRSAVRGSHSEDSPTTDKNDAGGADGAAEID